MRKSVLAIGAVAMMAALVVMGAGCRGDQPKKNYKGPFEGTAQQINVETGEVSMKMVHPKQGITMTVKGYINDKTQVEVNGMTARIEDIHQGDNVKVTGYNEGGSDKFIVTSISVHRADNGWIKVGDNAASSAPASQAATK